jgi:PEP-CTERM motif
MRRVLVLALLAMVLPIAAWADIVVDNQFGSISISNSGIFSNGVQLASWNGFSNGGSLGSVTFSTGTLLSGSITGTGGATFNGGGVFDVVGVGPWAAALTGQSHCGSGCALFTGSFSGPVSWTYAGCSAGCGTKFYTITGNIVGMLYNGRTVSGTTTQNVYTTGQQLNLGVGHLHAGSSNLNTPEPGTLGLLGTGLVGIAGMLRRKLIG